MEVDGAQEWPEWVMPAGAAEQRCEGWAREGEGQVPAGAQGEAKEDLEETEARPLSPKLPKSEPGPIAQPGERMGGGGEGKEFWEIRGSASGHQEGMKTKERKGHLQSP